MKKRDEQVHKRWSWQWIRGEAIGYAQALAIAFGVVTFLFTTVGVVGASMLPTLDGGPGSRDMIRSFLTGDRVFIPKYDTWLRRAGVLGDYQRGEVVVLRPPANAPSAQVTGQRDFYIKRIVAVAGDTVRIEAGRVVVNGHELDQSFLQVPGVVDIALIDFPVITQAGGQATGLAVPFLPAGGTRVPTHTQTGAYPPVSGVDDPWVRLYFGTTLESLAPVPEGAPENVPFVHELVIPPDHYFVAGDNRNPGASEDSRLFGPVPGMSIAGRASAVIWPPLRDGEWNWGLLTIPEQFAEIPD